jgi:hypothetical protein
MKTHHDNIKDQDFESSHLAEVLTSNLGPIRITLGTGLPSDGGDLGDLVVVVDRRPRDLPHLL